MEGYIGGYSKKAFYKMASYETACGKIVFWKIASGQKDLHGIS